MGDLDVAEMSEYFQEHPERWAIALGTAGLAALMFARRLVKSKGFFGKVWNLALLLVQVGAIAGLVKIRQEDQGPVWD